MLVDSTTVEALKQRKAELWNRVKEADKAAAETAEACLAKSLSGEWGLVGRLIEAAELLLKHEPKSPPPEPVDESLSAEDVL